MTRAARAEPAAIASHAASRASIPECGEPANRPPPASMRRPIAVARTGNDGPSAYGGREVPQNIASTVIASMPSRARVAACQLRVRTSSSSAHDATCPLPARSPQVAAMSEAVMRSAGVATPTARIRTGDVTTLTIPSGFLPLSPDVLAGDGAGVLAALHPLEVLHLDHQRQQITDVERRQLQYAVVVEVLLDDVHPVVALLELLRLGEEVVELVHRVDRHAEVVHAWALHRRLVRDEEDELAELVRHHHELAPVLGLRRQLLPAEHVAVELEERLSPLRIEQVGGDAHRDVVELRMRALRLLRRCWTFGCLGHVGFTITFRVISPAARPSIAASSPSRGVSSGSVSSSIGSAPLASRSRAVAKPPSS